MPVISRRNFNSLFGAAVVSGVLPSATRTAVAEAPSDFDFIFFTDTHIEPERGAVLGCEMAFQHMRGVRADFAIQGGDHVYDALQVPKARALSLFEMYDKSQQELSLKVYHTLGNHDCVGVFPQSGVAPTDPLYGKKYYEDHISRTFYSFDHKGVHFVVLDSIGFTPDRAYEGRVDAAQLAWLAKDLAAQRSTKPIVISTHIPLASAIDNYMPPLDPPPAHHGITVVNSSDVMALLEGHNIIGVLQGHTHINERVEWHGVPYITSGAVCGNWWQGTRLGTPEGYTVVSVRGGKLATRYETYGFKSIDPHNT